MDYYAGYQAGMIARMAERPSPQPMYIEVSPQESQPVRRQVPDSRPWHQRWETYVVGLMILLPAAAIIDAYVNIKYYRTWPDAWAMLVIVPLLIAAYAATK
jgi:hypothetical protein